MIKDTNITDVIFRKDTTKDFKGTIFALFAHEVATQTGCVTCYQHVGQHSSANYTMSIKESKLATESEYSDLKAELESIGYNLNVIKKQNYDKFLASYKNLFVSVK